ncbi:uncharacterized protein BJX67DRAFT_377406 [Aspergillus lucknowensis]|uniref:Zn(2)-C6 fungal-type domain-containing protein n=1 Tax=Aspergillus lucknowensis TaxID=176173 RepID=A0ABR4M511_9EURO
MSDEPPKPRPNKRVSNACIPCRSRHQRCDSATPSCSRCQQEGSRCVYVKSRRGGVRRRNQSQPFTACVPTQLHWPGPGPAQQITPRPSISPQSSLAHGPSGTENGYNPSTLFEENATDAAENELLSLYYSYFHAAHPCVLPQWSLRIRAALQPASIEVLMTILQYIGSLYSPAVESAALESKVLDALNTLRGSGRDPSPFEIQALLLYSVAVYWCDEIQRSLDLLDEAICGAVRIGMNTSVFDERYGEGDAVLEESWRRTWWVGYLCASHAAGSTRTFPSKMRGDSRLRAAANIPPAPSVDEYEMREFQSGSVCFSSFAELIGIARSLNFVLSEHWRTGVEAASRVCANADTAILAWLLLLPTQKQNLVHENGNVDQLLFRAHMLIYTYIVDLHREHSDLLHTSIESISRRSPRPPPLSLSLSRDLTWSPLNPRTNIHTTKVLTAIDKMNGLLTLPTHLSLHTPFIICMISNTAIAHLSAYKWVYEGPRLSIERERIRLVVAVLKTLSEFWPLGKRTYCEIVTIARDILRDSPPGTGVGVGVGAGVEVDLGLGFSTATSGIDVGYFAVESGHEERAVGA